MFTNLTNLRRTDNNSGLGPENMTFLYNFIVEHKCLKVLEIGMADGMSTIAILSALQHNSCPDQEVHLTSIDPFQSSQWKNNGVNNLKTLNLDVNHTLIEDLDMLALPKLMAANEKYDLIFIDGMHTFDHVLLNNFYADYLLNVNGFIINDDYWMPSIKKVCAYITNNYNHFKPLKAGVDARFCIIFQKLSEKNIAWNDFSPF